MPNWGLDSPGNQPTGTIFRKSRLKCSNHTNRNAAAIWVFDDEPICLECMEKSVIFARTGLDFSKQDKAVKNEVKQLWKKLKSKK